jgi:hypothetical protein
MILVGKKDNLRDLGLQDNKKGKANHVRDRKSP